MVCIYCGHPTRVTNSRLQKTSNKTWRRRQCQHCSAIFTTLERVNYETSLMFSGSKGRLEPFSRDILLLSIHRSLAHRKDAVRASTAITETILYKVISLKSPSIDRENLVSTCIETLRRFDKAAAVAYEAYHPT